MQIHQNLMPDACLPGSLLEDFSLRSCHICTPSTDGSMDGWMDAARGGIFALTTSLHHPEQDRKLQQIDQKYFHLGSNESWNAVLRKISKWDTMEGIFLAYFTVAPLSLFRLSRKQICSLLEIDHFKPVNHQPGVLAGCPRPESFCLWLVFVHKMLFFFLFGSVRFVLFYLFFFLTRSFAFWNAKYEQEADWEEDGGRGFGRNADRSSGDMQTSAFGPVYLFFGHSTALNCTSKIDFIGGSVLGFGWNSFFIDSLRAVVVLALPGITARIIVKPITPHLLFSPPLATWARLTISDRRRRRLRRVPKNSSTLWHSVYRPEKV